MGLRNTFLHLRSFHLLPSKANTPLTSPTSPRSDGREGLPLSSRRERFDNITIRGTTIVVLATLASIVFICSITVALIGRASDNYDQFTSALDEVSRFNPGILLVGEGVDIDIDEPSVTIRWFVVACGGDSVLQGSKGVLDHKACGLPVTGVNIFVDNNANPSFAYDPVLVPFDEDTARRKSLESAIHFETSHVLDVHQARQYPFDTYRLQIEFRAAALVANQTLPLSISRVLTVDQTSSFNVDSTDFRRYMVLNEIRSPTQRVDLHIKRPGSARLFTLLLYAISWLLTHICIGQVVIAKRGDGSRLLLCCLAICAGTLLALPQLRNSMPDAPGLDGILIDCIGYFPQMAIVGLCIIALLLMLAIRELDDIRDTQYVEPYTPNRRFCFPEGVTLSSPPPPRPRRPPPMYSQTDLSQWEMQRMAKHLRGDYVFPPISARASVKPDNNITWKPVHRRSKTMRAVSMLEEGEISRWSDHED